jgi:hypothetical protein
MRNLFSNILIPAVIILLVIGNLINMKRISERDHIIQDREKLVYTYQSIMNAAIQSKGDVEQMKKELQNDFRFHTDSTNEAGDYFVTAIPQNKEIMKMEIWDFFGVTLKVNEGKMTGIEQYKP